MTRALFPDASGPLEGADLEGRYLISKPGPMLRANFAVTADGAVEVGGVSASLSSPADHAAFFALRALADVILVGSGTVVAERYGPVRLSTEAIERRGMRGQDPLPPIAVVSGSANLDPGLRLFKDRKPDEPPPLLITCASAPESRRSALAAVAEVVLCGEERVDLGLALSTLSARGLQHVLCEGGPTLLGGILSAGLLDELCLTHAPMLAGPGHLQLVGGGALAGVVALRLLGLLEGDGELMARYAVEANDPAPDTLPT